MFHFENVGVTHPVQQQEPILKYLCCADCEWGPLGVVTATEFLLASDKVDLISYFVLFD
jgi:hypothetical protein